MASRYQPRLATVIAVASVMLLACVFMNPRDTHASHLPAYTSTGTSDGAYLEAWTEPVGYPTSTTWSSRGWSQSSQYIDRIGVTNEGQEFCDGVIYIRWRDPRTSNNNYYATAAGSARSYSCYYRHDYCPVSFHDFFRSGRFGWGPTTGRGGTWC
jgi:hypothetical protein